MQARAKPAQWPPLRLSPISSPPMEESFRLRVLALTCHLIAVLGLAWVGGNLWWVLIAGGLGILGHGLSWRWRHHPPRALSLLVVLLIIILALLMGFYMVRAFDGDWLWVGYFLVLVQALSSFDFRTGGGLYTGFALSGVVLFLASQQAFQLNFGVFIIGYFATVLGALALSITEDGEGGKQTNNLTKGPGLLATAPYWIGTLLALSLVSALAFSVTSRIDLPILGQPRVTLLPYSGAPWEGEETALQPGRDAAEASDDTATAYAAGFTLDSGHPGDAGSAAYGISAEGLGPSSIFTGEPASGNKNDVVFYVRSRVASYWRGRTLQTFDGAHWLTGDVVNPFERSTDNDRVWNNRDALFQNNPRLYEQTFLLQRDQLDSVFTGYGALRIIADEGSLDTFALRRGDSYQVISALPQHTPEVLGQDYAAGVSIQFKALPPNSEGLRTLAGQITLGSANDFEKAQRIVSYLDLNGRVEPGGLGNLTSMATLDEFLFEGKAGTVLDNATATVMLARASGLPARLAIGYLPGVRDRLSGAYVVRVGDAHAWAEVRFVDGGWVPFDSAAPSDVDNPWHFGATVSDLFKGIVGKDPFGFKGSIGQDVFGAIGAAPSRVGIALSTGLSRPGLSRALMIAGPLGFLYLLVIRWLWRRGAGRRRTNEGLVSGYSKLSGEGRRELLNLYAKAEKLIQQKAGGRRMPWQTVEGYTRLAALGNIEVQPHLSWFVQAVNQAAYSPDELPAGLVEETASRLKRLRAALKGSKRSGNALFGRHVWEPN